jgi:hypothetical protein
LETSWAAKLQPESQKLLWRTEVTPHDGDFSQEDQKDRRREMGVRAAAAEAGAPLRAAWRGEPSNLLIF